MAEPAASAGDGQFHSWWLIMTILVPNSISLLEEKSTTAKGDSVFQHYTATPTDHDALEHTLGMDDSANGGVVVIPNGRGGASPTAGTPVLYVPGLSTAWTKDGNDWTAAGAEEQLRKKTLKEILADQSSGVLGEHIPPESINDADLVDDWNGDGIEDLAIKTSTGVYLYGSQSDGSAVYYDQAILLLSLIHI